MIYAIVILINLAVWIAVIYGKRLGSSRYSLPDGQSGKSALAPSTLADARRLEKASEELPFGVVVVNELGEDTFRNGLARAFKSGRHGDALVEAAIAEVVEKSLKGELVEHEVELYGPPAKVYCLRGSPLYDNGVSAGAAVSVENVTKKHELERVRTDLVANVSHELRTPVGAIVALSDTLEDADDPEIRNRMVRRVQDQALRLRDIIEDLLTLSQVESVEPMPVESVDLVSIVRDVVEQASHTAEQRGVSLIGLNPAKGPAWVKGSRGQLTSIVANLCDNAIKYSPDNSRVVVTVDRIETAAVLKVQDTGIGIPESEIGRIFERFYRVDNARSRETGGSGLGLSIVRNALKSHGGSITVRSTEGRGSTFTVELPLSGTSQEDHSVEDPQSASQTEEQSP